MKKTLILALAAIALMGCEKSTTTTGAAKDHKVQTEFTAKISGSALRCVKIQYTLVDFEGNKFEGVLNENFDSKEPIEFKKVFSTGTPGKKATFKAYAMYDPQAPFAEILGPWEVSVYEKTTCEGLNDDQYGDKFAETSDKIHMLDMNLNFLTMGCEAFNRIWGSRTLTVTHTEEGYNAECPAQ